MLRSDNNLGIPKRPLQSRVLLDGFPSGTNGFINFSSVLLQQGDGLIATLDTTQGSYVKVTEYGLYAASLTIFDSVTTSIYYIGKNAASGTALANATDGTLWVAFNITTASKRTIGTSPPIECYPGDIIRAGVNSGGTVTVCRFDVVRVA